MVTSTTAIYTLSLHDALPISVSAPRWFAGWCTRYRIHQRSEEHTSELQSRGHLVCRPPLEKKNKKEVNDFTTIHKLSSYIYCYTYVHILSRTYIYFFLLRI